MKNRRSGKCRGLTRYAAKLLFQFRVGSHGTGKRECEIRTINFCEKTPRSALDFAKRFGRRSEHEYANSDGEPVRFEFVGVMDMLELFSADKFGAQETWYDMGVLNSPMESRARWIRSDEALIRALCNGLSKEESSAAWRLAIKRRKR